MNAFYVGKIVNNVRIKINAKFVKMDIFWISCFSVKSVKTVKNVNWKIIKLFVWIAQINITLMNKRNVFSVVSFVQVVDQMDFVIIA